MAWSHPVLTTARRCGIDVVSELDLGAAATDAPMVAVTGTNGKTTVTTLVAEMLSASGIHAVACGNTDVPLVAAIDDDPASVYVVEASSFRLAPTLEFSPRVAVWLNFAPDHLDWHPDLEHYRAAKAKVWAHQRPSDLAIGCGDDPVVVSALASAPGRRQRFGVGTGHYDLDVRDGSLRLAGGVAVVSVDELHRHRPHDVANALAAAGAAAEVGATPAAIADVLRAFEGLPHRVTPVGDDEGVTFYDDSKATTPHAVLAAIGGFDSAVLIAGGRNKGVDLGVLRTLTPRLRAVVAIGEAGPEVAEVFRDQVPVSVASSMDEAVSAAAGHARPGDAVVLSPGCASFDWYRSYAERGDDFTRAVSELLARRHRHDPTTTPAPTGSSSAGGPT
jgi:UDP-N-acetylmuramoylalanine--D-glutamate ligase